jgi:hypothetical protein
MKYANPRGLLGATLFATPGIKGGAHAPVLHVPILITVVWALIALAIVVTLIQRSWKTSPPDADSGDGPGWGRGPKRPRPDSPRGPRGGIPLDDALPARVRLRGHARLSDMQPLRPRRRVLEPQRRPARERTPA